MSNEDLPQGLQTINTIQAWLAPIKLIGMVLLLTGIGLALATIAGVLRWQSNRLWGFLS